MRCLGGEGGGGASGRAGERFAHLKNSNTESPSAGLGSGFTRPSSPPLSSAGPPAVCARMEAMVGLGGSRSSASRAAASARRLTNATSASRTSGHRAGAIAATSTRVLTTSPPLLPTFTSPPLPLLLLMLVPLLSLLPQEVVMMPPSTSTVQGPRPVSAPMRSRAHTSSSTSVWPTVTVLVLLLGASTTITFCCLPRCMKSGSYSCFLTCGRGCACSGTGALLSRNVVPASFTVSHGLSCIQFVLGGTASV